MDLRSIRHAFGQNAFHFVWNPKYAKDPIKFIGIRADCERFIRKATEKYRFSIYELHIAVGHIPLFVEMPPARVLVKHPNCLKEVTPLNNCTSIHCWESILGKDISGILESSSEVWAIQLAKLLSTTSVLLSSGLIWVDILFFICLIPHPLGMGYSFFCFSSCKVCYYRNKNTFYPRNICWTLTFSLLSPQFCLIIILFGDKMYQSPTNNHLV